NPKQNVRIDLARRTAAMGLRSWLDNILNLCLVYGPTTGDGEVAHMNPVERLLHEEVTRFLDRLASSVPSDGVTSHAMTPTVRTRLEEAEKTLAHARASLMA